MHLSNWLYIINTFPMFPGTLPVELPCLLVCWVRRLKTKSKCLSSTATSFCVWWRWDRKTTKICASLPAVCGTPAVIALWQSRGRMRTVSAVWYSMACTMSEGFCFIVLYGVYNEWRHRWHYSSCSVVLYGVYNEWRHRWHYSFWCMVLYGVCDGWRDRWHYRFCCVVLYGVYNEWRHRWHYSFWCIVLYSLVWFCARVLCCLMTPGLSKDI